MPSSRNTLTCTPTSAAAFACELRAVVREVLLRFPPKSAAASHASPPGYTSSRFCRR
jgi:hypothetical protein